MQKVCHLLTTDVRPGKLIQRKWEFSGCWQLAKSRIDRIWRRDGLKVLRNRLRVVNPKPFRAESRIRI